jgi:hypothetical protein
MKQIIKNWNELSKNRSVLNKREWSKQKYRNELSKRGTKPNQRELTNQKQQNELITPKQEWTNRCYWNLGWDNSYPEALRCFSQPLHVCARIMPRLSHDCISLNPFQILMHSYPAIWRCKFSSLPPSLKHLLQTNQEQLPTTGLSINALNVEYRQTELLSFWTLSIIQNHSVSKTGSVSALRWEGRHSFWGI